MRYAYYPGCSLHGSAKEYDRSARAVCEALGIELEEIPDWVCCGASSAHMTSELLALALPVRNLVAARDRNLEVLTCCAACFSRLRVANRAMSHDGERAALVDEVVEATYRGETPVTHLLDVIANGYGVEAVSGRVQRSLEGIKVASYYGCLLVRPPELGLDDPENPMVMDRLVSALGAEPVNWSHKTECCGGSLSLTRTDMVLRLCADILSAAADQGADCLVAACPLCQANLDLRQGQIRKAYGLHLDLPILYFTQLVGLAMGIGPKVLGLDKLMVSPLRLIESRALA